MRRLFAALLENLKAGNDAVLVSTVLSTGSVPRGSGAHMLVTGQGRIEGTIGGGIAEHMAEQTAMEVLKNGRNAGGTYELRQNGASGIDSVCGGDVEVFFRFLSASDPEVVRLAEDIAGMFASGTPCRLILELTERTDGLIAVISADKAAEGIPERVAAETSTVPKVLEEDGRRFYTEQLIMPGTVYIFGGGHVSQQLVPVLARCDFRCVVLEDRPEFADPRLFEGVSATRVIDPDALDVLSGELTADDYVCVMTRGHRKDYECVYHMLKSQACYVGVIGSRNKVAVLKDRLRSDGFTEQELDRLVTPIGLEIYSETPAEIAVSIAAQLIMVRAVKNGSRKAKKAENERKTE